MTENKVHNLLFAGTCPLCSGILSWFPLLALSGLPIAFQNHFPEKWIFMWVLAFAFYFGCKWLTLVRARINGVKGGLARSLGYLLLWPGMDAKRFMADSEVADTPATGEWLAAAFKFILGAIILWGVTPRIGETSTTLSAWTGMLGLTLMLHFGSFHLISLAWRSSGVVAEPIMRSPVTATSLSLFWSERWNRGFNQLAHDLVFRATYRRGGVSLGILLVFLVSGLVHDLIISLPAGALFGLPTAYFMIQGIGVLIERSHHGRRLGLKGGAKGWVFMCIFTVGPAYWLFHEPFVLNVILPFLKAIKAL
jgi:hypothetical protein